MVHDILKKVEEEGGVIVIPHPFASKIGLLDSARKISTKMEWLESGFLRLTQAPEDKIRYIDWDEHGHWINRFVLASASVDQVEASTYCLAPINVTDCYQEEKVLRGSAWPSQPSRASNRSLVSQRRESRKSSHHQIITRQL
jgi:hypothetical protein